MTADDAVLSLRLAQGPQDLLAAQRLRYQVFALEMGASGPTVDHQARLERDEFDTHVDHLLLVDTRRDPLDLDHVVGAYRLLPPERLAAAGRYYSEGEFDLSRLKTSGRRLLELGRTCVHPDVRGGAAMVLMWNGLAEYVLERRIEVLFGAASFPGVNAADWSPSLAYLHHFHRAPEELRVTARAEQGMDLSVAADIDKVTALARIPALIRAYLRLGGFVSDGAFVDHAFNTTDVCLVMDTAQMSQRHKAYYTRKKARE